MVISSWRNVDADCAIHPPLLHSALIHTPPPSSARPSFFFYYPVILLLHLSRHPLATLILSSSCYTYRVNSSQGTDGNDGPEREWEKPLEEIRFSECYVAVCMDRHERPDEPKNFPFWGVRQATHIEHLKWARYDFICVYLCLLGLYMCWQGEEWGSDPATSIERK